MFKAIIFGLTIALFQTANALEFSSKEITSADGKSGFVFLRLDDYGIYSVLFRGISEAPKTVLCETVKNGYWEHARGEFLFWSLGKGMAVHCKAGVKCLSLELGRDLPLFSEQVVEVSEVPEGTLKQTPNSPLCQ